MQLNSSLLTVIDALRGFALAGVCLAHMMEQYLANRMPEAAVAIANTGTIDQVVMSVVQIFVVGKFYLIFSFLFGVSFYLQISGAQARQQPFYLRYLWRLVLLFGFGFLHHLFYRGDILMVYAVLGLFLLPLSSLSSRN